MLRSWDVVVFFLFLGQIFWKIKEFHTLSILPTKVRDHITLYIRNIIIHHFIHFVLLNYLFLLLLTNNIFLKLIRNSLSWIFFQFLAKMWFSFVFLYFFFIEVVEIIDCWSDFNSDFLPLAGDRMFVGATNMRGNVLILEELSPRGLVIAI